MKRHKGNGGTDGAAPPVWPTARHEEEKLRISVRISLGRILELVVHYTRVGNWLAAKRPVLVVTIVVGVVFAVLYWLIPEPLSHIIHRIAH